MLRVAVSDADLAICTPVRLKVPVGYKLNHRQRLDLRPRKRASLAMLSA